VRCLPLTARASNLTLQPPLHINALAHSAQKGLLAVAGPDGYLCVLPAGMEGKEEAKPLKGHVGDVLDVKFFPSGEVRSLSLL
jgi:proteasomal ATPase-associated factor 1